MAAWTAVAARQASNLTRLSSPKPHALLHRRCMGGGGDPHGPPKVNIWEDPISPSRWKEEHFVIVSLAGWGAFIYGTYKFLTKGKKEEKVGEAPNKA